MRASTALMIATAAALAGCATPHHRFDPFGKLTPKPCSGNDCDVNITVEPNCSLKLDGDILQIIDDPSPARRRPRNIRWNIETAGYRFASDPKRYAIVIHDFDPTREFNQPKIQHDKQFTIHFNNSYSHDYPGYKYTINIETDNGVSCAAYDPWVVN